MKYHLKRIFRLLSQKDLQRSNCSLSNFEQRENSIIDEPNDCVLHFSNMQFAQIIDSKNNLTMLSTQDVHN
jgi:hypothetical protein